MLICWFENYIANFIFQEAVFSSEEIRGFRLLSMLNKEGRFVLRMCMVRLLPQFADKTFEEYLAQSHIKRRVVRAYKYKIISKDQFVTLYPMSGKPAVESLHISIMVFLLRQLHPSLKPNDQIWKNPPDSDISIEADITRMIKSRNRLAHMVAFTEVDFETEYKQIEVVLCRLIGSVGGSFETAKEIKKSLVKKKCWQLETKPDELDVTRSALY